MVKLTRKLRASRIKGGKLGGPARALKLGPARCQEIATQAARARWDSAKQILEAKA